MRIRRRLRAAGSGHRPNLHQSAECTAALLTFHRSHHHGCAAETTASRRRTAISGAKEIRQHVFHESSEDRILIVQGSAIANRAPIKDPATVEALPVNQLPYRIYIHRIEEIVEGVAAYSSAVPLSERSDPSRLNRIGLPVRDRRCPYHVKCRDPHVGLVADRILCERLIGYDWHALEQKMVSIVFVDVECAKIEIACGDGWRGRGVFKTQNSERL